LNIKYKNYFIEVIDNKLVFSLLSGCGSNAKINYEINKKSGSLIDDTDNFLTESAHFIQTTF